jgi:hypothetical protein
MNWKELGRKWLRSILRYYPSANLEGPRKNHRNLRQNSWSPDYDFNPGLPQYGTDMLIT